MRNELLTLTLQLPVKPNVDALCQTAQLGHERTRPCWQPMPAAPGDIRSKRQIVVDRHRRVVRELLALVDGCLARRGGKGRCGQCVLFAGDLLSRSLACERQNVTHRVQKNCLNL